MACSTVAVGQRTCALTWPVAGLNTLECGCRAGDGPAVDQVADGVGDGWACCMVSFKKNRL
jgi:hypothetical protein